MTHQWLATWFIPSDIIEEVMSKRYVMNQKQSGVFSSWFDELALEEPAEGTPKEQFYHIFSELDRDSFEAFLRDNPEYIADGYDHIDIDLIGDDMTRKNYDTGIRTTQGDTVLAINAEHGIMIVEIVGEDSLGMEYAGKLALCKQPKNVFVGTCEGLFEYGSYVTEMADPVRRQTGHQRLRLCRLRGQRHRRPAPTAFSKARARSCSRQLRAAGRSSGLTKRIICRSANSPTPRLSGMRSNFIRRSSSTAKIWSRAAA